MDQPYIQIPREFFNGDFWKSPRTYSFQEAMLDLAYMVAYQDRSYIINNKVLELKKGECVASLRFLGKRYNWSTKKVSGFLNALKKTHNLTQTKRQGESVLNFDISSTYETQHSKEETASNTENNTEEQRKRNAEETAKKQQGNKIEEGKESKEGKYKENIKEILETRLLRIAKCIFPNAKLPRPAKELKAWSKISKSVTDEEIELMEKFYALDKSDSYYDETWHRKQDVPSLMNNWQATIELAAKYFSSESRDRRADALDKKINNPPYFQNNQEDGDVSLGLLNGFPS